MIHEKLSLPAFDYKRKQQGGRSYIFDPLRKKYVFLSPEEWVRQHMINYLVYHLRYPMGLIAVERCFPSQYKRMQRADLLIYNRQHKPVMLIECKAPQQKLSHAIIRQMMRYNSHQLAWLVFSNGCTHFCFKLDTMQNHYVLLQEMPTFAQVSKSLSDVCISKEVDDDHSGVG